MTWCPIPTLCINPCEGRYSLSLSFNCEDPVGTLASDGARPALLVTFAEKASALSAAINWVFRDGVGLNEYFDFYTSLLSLNFYCSYH
jgi:hypothetical protein